MKYRVVKKSPTHFSVQVDLSHSLVPRWHQIEIATSIVAARAALDKREVMALPGTIVEEREISFEGSHDPEPLHRDRPAGAASAR